MKLKAAGDKLILKREEVFARNLPLGLGGQRLVVPGGKEDPKKPTVFGRIISIGPDVKGPFAPGQLVVFGSAAQVTFRDGSEFVITVAGGILAFVEDDAVGEIVAVGTTDETAAPAAAEQGS
jgi:hypothetical protein